MRNRPDSDYDKRTISVVICDADTRSDYQSHGGDWTKFHDKRDDFNFPIANFPFICSSIPAAPAYGVYISQMIRYSSGTRRVNLVTNPVISREWGKNREVLTTSGTYPWSFVTQIFHNGQPSHGVICTNIPAAPAYGVYISQMIWYSRACGSYQDFLDRGLLLTRKLLNKGFLLVKLKSSLRNLYGRHIKHTYKTEDRVTRTPLKIGGELRCSGRVGSSCSSSDIRRVNLVTNPIISREWGKNREVLTTSGTYPW
jgi:hypothetical protein